MRGAILFFSSIYYSTLDVTKSLHKLVGLEQNFKGQRSGEKGDLLYLICNFTTLKLFLKV